MKYTIKDFQKEFPNDDVCLDYIFSQRFGHIEDFDKYYRVKNRKCYAHSKTGEQIHPTAGTIFHKSATKLTLWFYAIFLMSQGKNGVAAKELERHLGVTYKCAYRIGQQIRKLMVQDGDLLSGVVEADETYVGGKGGNNKKGRGAENKTPVFGMVQRQGGIKAKAVSNVKSSTVMPLLRENVEVGTKLMTDEYAIYNKANEDFEHQKVHHASKEYVRDDVHTNTIEGFWSQLKRSIRGTYHFVSPKRLQVYVDEFAFRYNYRSSDLHPFGILLERI